MTSSSRKGGKGEIGKERKEGLKARAHKLKKKGGPDLVAKNTKTKVGKRGKKRSKCQGRLVGLLNADGSKPGHQPLVHSVRRAPSP